jgi:hypothetical protein
MGHYKCAANIVPKNIETMNFWTRNEGQLVATIGGIVIALIAAYLTFYFSNLQTKRKEKENYDGMLYVLHVELFWQNNQLDMLKRTLEKLKTTSINEREFVIENPPAQFNLAIIELCLEKIVDYKDYKHELVVLLVSYINQIKELNYILDFRNARDILSKINKNETREIEERIGDYFDVFDIEYIDKAKPNISMIRKIIENELKDYPKEKMIFKEDNKTIKINK